MGSSMHITPLCSKQANVYKFSTGHGSGRYCILQTEQKIIISAENDTEFTSIYCTDLISTITVKLTGSFYIQGYDNYVV